MAVVITMKNGLSEYLPEVWITVYLMPWERVVAGR